MSKTDAFKAYLNNIIDQIDSQIHNDLWNHLIEVIGEKEELKQQLEEAKGHIRTARGLLLNSNCGSYEESKSWADWQKKCEDFFEKTKTT